MEQGQSHLPLVVTVTHSVGSTCAVRARWGQPHAAPPEGLQSFLCSLCLVFVCGNPGQRHTSSSCPSAAVTVLCQAPLALTPPDSRKALSSHPAVGSVCCSCCCCCWLLPRLHTVPRVPPPAVTSPQGRTGSVIRFPTYSPHLAVAAAPEQPCRELLKVPWLCMASLLPSSCLCPDVEGFLGAARQHLPPPLTFWKRSSVLCLQEFYIKTMPKFSGSWPGSLCFTQQPPSISRRWWCGAWQTWTSVCCHGERGGCTLARIAAALGAADVGCICPLSKLNPALPGAVAQEPAVASAFSRTQGVN